MGLNYKHIGRRIREERIRTGMSQEKLAELADSSPQYISHIKHYLSLAGIEASEMRILEEVLLEGRLPVSQINFYFYYIFNFILFLNFT